MPRPLAPVDAGLLDHGRSTFYRDEIKAVNESVAGQETGAVQPATVLASGYHSEGRAIMPFQENLILLPCHSLDDFPVYHTGEDAQSLLANWSALWHPFLLKDSGKLPSWQRVDDPPESCADLLLVVPTISLKNLPTGFTRRAAEEGGCLISEGTDRDAIARFAIEFATAGHPPELDCELVSDFFALGYCYLQIQLLTRHMRYSSNLDTLFFEAQAIAAANAVCDQQLDIAKEKLQACFDVLAEERDHFYPVDAFLLDLTLVASSTINQSLRAEIESPSPSNLLMSGRIAESIGAQDASLTEAMSRCLEDQRAALVGGEFEEIRSSLLTHEVIHHNLQRGISAYQKHFGVRPTVFGRRRFGLCASLPQLLVPLGFRGAVHSTLDEGRFPEGLPLKISWESSNAAAIDAYAKVPIDASKPETFLNLAVKMGEQMDMDHVATVCFAHWPGQQCIWYDDLRRATKYSGALGKFLTFHEFFEQASDPGFGDRFRAEQYRSPFLKQSVEHKEANPISSVVRFWYEQAAVRSARAVEFLNSSLKGTNTAAVDPQSWTSIIARSEQASLAANDAGASSQLDAAELEQSEVAHSISSALQKRVDAAVARFAEQLPREGEPRPGYLLVNPSSFARRVVGSYAKLETLPEQERPIYAASEVDGEKQVVADVPALGFTWIGSQKPKRPARKKSVPLAEEFLLRNEYCELVVDQTSGGIRSIHEYNERKNRISQQLAMRLRAALKDEEHDHYSRMVADEIKTVRASETSGQIVSRGKLLGDDEETVATFVQTMTIWRGSRIIEVDVLLEPTIELKAAPWESYFASRFAWKEEAADLWCGVNQQRQAATKKRIESPEYIEIECDEKRTTILTGGLPYHQKYKLNMLDSLLIVKGEKARRFRFGIAIDATHPTAAAEDFICPKTRIDQVAGAPQPTASSCLFHVDAKNVIATDWELQTEASESSVRLRLLETMGRDATARLQSFRSFKSGRVVDLLGNTVRECDIEQGRAIVPIEARQFVQVELQW